MRRLTVPVLVAGVLLLGACGSDDGDAAPATSEQPPVTQEAETAGLEEVVTEVATSEVHAEAVEDVVVVPDAYYASLEALRVAVDAAGATCAYIGQELVHEIADGSVTDGSCQTFGSRVAVASSSAARDAFVDELVSGNDELDFLIGPNWLFYLEVEPGGLDSLQSALGGIVQENGAARGAQFEYRCRTDDWSFIEVSSREEALSLENITNCHATYVGGVLSDIEQEAVAAAGYDEDSDIEHLEGMCAALSGHPWDSEGYSPPQAEEVRGAIVLCPEHPGVPNAETVVASSIERHERHELDLLAEDEGRYIPGDGSYLIGDAMVPGTWEITLSRVEDCYWELSDASGNIIDNNFISVAPQFSIVVSPSVTGFTTSGCGPWRWVG